MTAKTRHTDTPFSLIGGEAGVDRLVETFYRRMDALPEARGIRALHRADLTSTKSVLKLYLGEWLGGPDLYSRERGHPRLRMRHMHVAIGPADRDAWMLCMRGAVEEVVESEKLRDILLEKFFKLADWVRNDQGSPHDAHRTDGLRPA
ncbi:MAG: group II truncated hemoglobin [Stellaceae bacterium]